MEAVSHGIPTIAISQQLLKSEEMVSKGSVDINFDLAKEVLNKVAKKVLNEGLPEGSDFLNINIPFNPASEEIVITKLGGKMFTPKLVEYKDPIGMPYYWLSGDRVNEGNIEGTDVYVLESQNKISITPLSMDFTGNMINLENWIK